MQQGFNKYSDKRQGYSLNSTCGMGINKRQRHATLAFLKIDRRHGDPHQGPLQAITVGRGGLSIVLHALDLLPTTSDEKEVFLLQYLT